MAEIKTGTQAPSLMSHKRNNEKKDERQSVLIIWNSRSIDVKGGDFWNCKRVGN
mgnify:CR=1 FL=1